jgi:hypothetical protein
MPTITTLRAFNVEFTRINYAMANLPPPATGPQAVVVRAELMQLFNSMDPEFAERIAELFPEFGTLTSFVSSPYTHQTTSISQIP